jgi:hypothetical protein
MGHCVSLVLRPLIFWVLCVSLVSGPLISLVLGLRVPDSKVLCVSLVLGSNSCKILGAQRVEKMNKFQVWDPIVRDIHLEHYLENENQRFCRVICSKYTVRTPTKNIYLEQVFQDVLRTLWGNLCVLSVCPQFRLCVFYQVGQKWCKYNNTVKQLILLNQRCKIVVMMYIIIHKVLLHEFLHPPQASRDCCGDWITL